MRLHLQFSAFAVVGVAAAIVHYGLLIGLVQGGVLRPVPAALCGYVGGGLVSYALSRAHVFESARSHVEAGWRFVAVAAVGFCLTFAFMHLFVDRFGAPYLIAQVVTTGVVMIWSFLAHKFWTFGGGPLT
ncbi:MAG: GtrA family protein [Hyphomicrobiales bacterium]|nr:GtrA family protein [Hyphomicrobiales bacterium]